jgi:hypothetical protein
MSCCGEMGTKALVVLYLYSPPGVTIWPLACRLASDGSCSEETSMVLTTAVYCTVGAIRGTFCPGFSWPHWVDKPESAASGPWVWRRHLLWLEHGPYQPRCRVGSWMSYSVRSTVVGGFGANWERRVCNQCQASVGFGTYRLADSRYSLSYEHLRCLVTMVFEAFLLLDLGVPIIHTGFHASRQSYSLFQ